MRHFAVMLALLGVAVIPILALFFIPSRILSMKLGFAPVLILSIMVVGAHIGAAILTYKNVVMSKMAEELNPVTRRILAWNPTLAILATVTTTSILVMVSFYYSSLSGFTLRLTMVLLLPVLFMNLFDIGWDIKEHLK